MAANKNKLVVTCRSFPPSVGGSQILLTNLLRVYDGDVEAVVGWEYESKFDFSFTPPCKTHYLRFMPPYLQRVMWHFTRVYFFFIKWFVYFKLRQIRPTAVLAACTPDGLFFTASFLACRRLKIPFWAQMHDLWLENASPGDFPRKLAEKWEPIIFREADKIYCMTSSQAEYYKSKYNRDCELLPHCISPDVKTPDDLPVKTTGQTEEKLILYTGSTSHAMNLDALREFVKAVDLLPSNYQVRMLVGDNIDWYRANGIYRQRIKYGWVSVQESERLVRTADVLFLPLSFKNCSAAEVKTVFATKTLSYLTAGVPILVFSPPDSFHSLSAGETGWGYVVQTEDTHLLADKLQELANNPILREQTVRNAVEESQRRDPRRWAKSIEREVSRLSETRPER
jgi:glycosyltransferase involved in cell wall biosynthesis